MNVLLRTIIEKSGIADMNAMTIIPPDVDEWEANSNLELLNNNMNISDPIP